MTSAAATALQAAIATAEAEATASDTVIAETVAAEVDDTDKAKDSSGEVAESISYVIITDGQVAFNTTDAGTVTEATTTDTARAEFDTVVATVKAIVSQN
ncbi:MAG: hypothetical protein GY893_10865 [bacterium]|nr:hypothetical protein [bacterium]